MLTDPACKQALCPHDKVRIRLTDAGGPYLEVTPNGSKRWFVKYRFAGKEKRLALVSRQMSHDRAAIDVQGKACNSAMCLEGKWAATDDA